jgi:exopolysaccharide biosynthesis predicted pyruvyltransferase EpsI
MTVLQLANPPDAAPERVLRQTFEAAILRDVPTAFLDYPDHDNVGDSAIWAGSRRCLREMGVNLRYTADLGSYNEEVMRRRMPFGQILMHGGGNFGTLWPWFQAFREAVAERCRDYRIVQLPQSLHFNDEASLARARQRFGAHPDYLLMVRDLRSQAIARDELKLRSLLCPDAALSLQGVFERSPAVVDVLVLARGDHESRDGGLRDLSLPGRSVEVADWQDSSPAGLRRQTRLLARIGHSGWGGIGAIQRMQLRLFDRLAEVRVAEGARLLSRGRVVVTDRLHAHILCVLMGIPHVVLDNNYGKISQFIGCWHAGRPGMHLVGSLPAAREAVLALLASLAADADASAEPR